MRCPCCNGNGSVPYPIDYEQGLFDETNCDLCGGTGRVVTNDEWRRTCSMEEFAEFLCNVAVTDILWDRIRQPYYTDEKQAVVEWLKEKHK